MAPGSWQEKEIQAKFCQMLAQPTRWQTLASASKFTFSNKLDTLCEIPHYVALELSQGQKYNIMDFLGCVEFGSHPLYWSVDSLPLKSRTSRKYGREKIYHVLLD